MKIKKLTLNNFMAFDNAEINWSDNINIICGENSTGKTTLLKVMYSLIKPFSSGDKDNLTKEMEEQVFVKKIQGVFRPDEMKIGRLVSRKQGSNRTDFSIVPFPVIAISFALSAYIMDCVLIRLMPS